MGHQVCWCLWGKAKSERCALRYFLKVATEVVERTDSGRLFQRERVQEGHALAPASVLILETSRVVPLFAFREWDGSDGANIQ